MVGYQIFYTKKALEDIPKLKNIKLDEKAKRLIELIKNNPFENPPPYEKLKGILQGAYSRRINIKHRFVYEVLEQDKAIKIISLWSHYEF
ncbi:Txe/YoeB family addiction module toxin [uncultured Helicobacter sp.]|uniref:Txe/YoeB family addiction module toxin n=1 Tax=uncultured Helicobacter sp. TaxID=175537 RepID=UPI002624EDF2|nr:Txe/YoeB family addiction module toxin [uncultured Helicobacter sp.]